MKAFLSNSKINKQIHIILFCQRIFNIAVIIITFFIYMKLQLSVNSSLKSVGLTRLETVCSLPVLPVYMAPPTLQRIMNVHVSKCI